MYFWSVSLVDQLSGQFHIFLVDQLFFWSTQNQFLIFLVDQFLFGKPKTIFSCFWSTNFFLVIQKKNWSTKKKWEIDRTIGRPRDWPKVHGRR